MGKFVRKIATSVFALLAMTTFFLSGCASVETSGYISRADHPYDRKMYANLEKVTSAVVYVLRSKGWTISTESDPAIYERNDRYDNSSYRNILIITDVRKKSLHLTSMRLNVFIYSVGDTCDLEIRYEAQKSLVNPFDSVRNDQMVNGILDAVEQELNG